MKLQFVVSNQTNPYLNIAFENYLVATPSEDTVTMYLWKNRRTVVIGQNQNPFAECNVDALEADGGYLMRRRTGGGAVYHDDGNLNFSFIAPPSLYDQQRQFAVIQRAVADFGIEAEISGRNDVIANGRKFSGNAFSRGQHNYLHHGTLLICGNIEDLQRYLKPKPAKLQKHGVSSVQSRVVNLGELNAAITSESIVPHLRDAFTSVYGGLPLSTLDFEQMKANPEVQRLRDEFASDQWRLGSWRSFTAQRSAQFDWGGVELQLNIEDGIIRDVQIASDALDLAALDETRRLLAGADTTKKRPQTGSAIVNDILSLVY